MREFREPYDFIDTDHCRRITHTAQHYNRDHQRRTDETAEANRHGNHIIPASRPNYFPAVR
ncbi:hypothetical protein [Halorussus caseinilyticus]|uniref:Uncharacterized protein n=1 Tax=Halorussus caseinilyticus TaxID=3034025 RepID=A0ABD5WEV8_9EURY|nr:hypothetical protein [Halorussus sp. DT72]